MLTATYYKMKYSPLYLSHLTLHKCLLAKFPVIQAQLKGFFLI